MDAEIFLPFSLLERGAGERVRSLEGVFFERAVVLPQDDGRLRGDLSLRPSPQPSPKRRGRSQNET